MSDLTELNTAVNKVQTNVVAAQDIETEVKSFIQKHERFLLISFALIIGVFLGNKVLDANADRDRAAANQSAQVLTQQQAINQQLAAQAAKNASDYKALVVQLTQQNAVLQTQIAQRQVVYQTQVATDKTLPMPDLGNRWAKLAQLNPTDIQATAAGITVTPQGAFDTVTDLEQVPVLQADIADANTEKANLASELNSSEDLNNSLVTEVAGLKTSAADQDKTCKAEIASTKATARKGKLRSFLYGVGVGAGAVTVLVLHALL